MYLLQGNIVKNDMDAIWFTTNRYINKRAKSE